jgi:putative addiction module killer protein
MSTIRRTELFDHWLKELRDSKARAKILVRLDRLKLGNPGDVEPVGDGISEMRIHYGPGYRVYFKRRGEEVIIILAGGSKSTQDRDIAQAKLLASQLEE